MALIPNVKLLSGDYWLFVSVKDDVAGMNVSTAYYKTSGGDNNLHYMVYDPNDIPPETFDLYNTYSGDFIACYATYIPRNYKRGERHLRFGVK